VGGVLIAVVLGTIETGRVLHIQNQVSYAADRAARLLFIDPNASEATVEAHARASFGGPHKELLAFNLAEETVDGQEMLRVTLSYPTRFRVPGLDSRAIQLQASRRAPAS
jgi:Flp pilus assembly protein TadG